MGKYYNCRVYRERGSHCCLMQNSLETDQSCSDYGNMSEYEQLRQI